MKKDIHPQLHELKVVMTDGSEYTTRSTLNMQGEKMTLAVDPKNHPAYTGKMRNLDTAGRGEKFAARYGIKK
jgi:large subunit ribosomal protein L31